MSSYAKIDRDHFARYPSARRNSAHTGSCVKAGVGSRMRMLNCRDGDNPSVRWHFRWPLFPAGTALCLAALTTAAPHKIQNTDHYSEYDEYDVKSAHDSSLPGSRIGYLDISVKARKSWIPPGPRMKTRSSGTMKGTRGKTSLTGVLWAASRALWRRLDRSESA